MMKRDTALTAALAASLGYAVIVGVVSSSGPGDPVSPDSPIAVEARFADSGRTVLIGDPAEVLNICGWLDEAFENPRKSYDLKWFSPPTNELIVYLASGERATIFFSGGDPERKQAARKWHKDGYVLLRYEGASYIAKDQLPASFGGTGDGESGEPRS